jgi:hypothetical protein
MNCQQIIAAVLKEANIEKAGFVIKTKYDEKYQSLINKIRRLSWNEKPKQIKQSASTSIEGEIGDYEVSFSWHSPSTEWGPIWAFTGLLYKKTGKNFEEAFNKTWVDVNKSTEGIGLRGIDFINFAKQDKFDDKIQQENLREFEKAIEFIQRLR